MTSNHGISRAEQTQQRRKHILAIDGASDFLEVLRHLFVGERYNVTTTNFVERTHNMIVALAPDLLIVDLAMGQQAGWRLLEHLHRDGVTRNIPLLLTSAAPELLRQAQADVERYGRPSVLAKPMDIDDLLSAVDELIGPA